MVLLRHQGDTKLPERQGDVLGLPYTDARDFFGVLHLLELVATHSLDMLLGAVEVWKPPQTVFVLAPV